MYYDFKVSKVAKKSGKARIPHPDKPFVYVIKPTSQYAIFENGEYGNVPTRRSYAYRVPKVNFEKILQTDKSLLPDLSPEDFDSFFKIVLLLDNIQKTPKNTDMGKRCLL